MAVDTSAAPAPPDDRTDTDLEPVRRSLRGAVLPLVLVAVAAGLRFYRLDYPERMYFDEIYYAVQAQEYLTLGVEKGFAVHPPVGKWLIAAGIAVFGDNSLGWRAAPAAAGSLTVLVTYLLGLRLFRRRGIAALAAFFVTVDGLAFTMSRISMLDAFLALFVTLGVWLLVLDRDALWAGAPVEPDPQRPLPPRPRRWRWLAGVAFGLALATKWSAILAVGGGGLFVLVSEMLWRRRLTGSAWREFWRIPVSGVLTLVVVPLVVYVLSHAGWFANFSENRIGDERCPDGVCNLSAVDMVGEWFTEQRAIATFHGNLEAEHSYRSRAETWPLLIRPVAYYYENCTDEKLADDECVTEQGQVEETLGIGNPAIWWAALAGYLYAAWAIARWRDWRVAVPLGFVSVQYLPWLFVPRPNFLFYMTPVVPFLCLTLAWAVGRAGRHPLLAWLPAAVATLAAAAFLFWYPVLSGIEISQEAWKLRMWMDSWI